MTPEPVRWNLAGPKERLAVVSLLGWATAKGSPTRLGQRIARTNWDDLSPAARNVLTRAGVKGE